MAERSNAAVLFAESCGKTVDPKVRAYAKLLVENSSILFHTYIIKSLKDQGYYFGHCHDIDTRISKHNAGRVKSTKSRKPFILHYFESFTTKSEAYRRELFFKSFEGRQWLYQNKIL